MGGKYNTGDPGKEGNMMYDDAAFQLFVVAILATVWIPWCLFRIIRFIRRSLHTKTPLEEAKEAWCSCSLCQQKAEKLTTKTGLERIGIGNIIFALLTIAFFLLSIRVYQANLTAEPPFDPFAILDVSESSTPREIKKAFRRLSIIHHPDKNRDDPTAGERFIKISKAFSALTDETAKANFIKYGNPDGYMGTTLGLGLPEWVAESGGVVLALYFLFMVLLFPLIVGTWWHKRSQQFNSEVLTQTLVLYGETLKQSSKFRDLLSAFCGSFEFSKLYDSDHVEHLQSIIESLKRLGNTDIRKRKYFSEAQRSNLLVLTAYLARVPIPKQLQSALDAMLMRGEPLLTVMTDTSGAFQRPECRSSWNKQLMRGHTLYLATCIGMQQCVIQALDEKDSPLLQIPHITDQEVMYCGSSRNSVRTIYDFMKLETEDQRKLLRGFSDDQFLDVQAFCSRYPSANLDVTEAYVEEEEDSSVHAGDTVTVKAKLTVMRRSGSAFSPHTPNLPYRKEEVWWIWLADQKHRAPIEVKRLLPRMARGHDPNRRRRSRDSCCGVGEEQPDEHQHDEHLHRLTKDPRVTVFNVKFRFLAPKPGLYNLEVVAACDCYKGASKTSMIKMKVEKEVEPPPEDSVRYFDTDDESSSEDSSSSEKEETDGEYEYVTDNGEENDAEGDENDADDTYGISGASHGDPAS